MAAKWNRSYRDSFVGAAIALLAGGFLAACAAPYAAAATSREHRSGPPIPGMHAYVRGHAKHQNPPDRLGGPLTVTVTQENGSTRLALPGPRRLDPSVFGTPEKPVGFEPAPFPLYGTPEDFRMTLNGHYSVTNHATPFSDWREVGVGSLKMKVVDATAIDGARTKDNIDFEATFKLPDGVGYRVVCCKKPLAHGMAFPTFGGVVTNHLLHGNSGIGTKLMPTEFTYVAFWGVGDVYREGKLINPNHLIHVMVTEIVRGEGYDLHFDGGVGDPPQGKTLHLMIPPYKPVPGKGMVRDNLKTMFMPFPYVERNIKADMKAAKQAGDQERIAMLKQIRQVMGKTKEHVLHATKELKEGDPGKMWGMPFIHIMFGNIKMTASH
ncbi:MAG: hypothetical protein ACE5JU_13965 [Candidatus Binatia bacterium]